MAKKPSLKGSVLDGEAHLAAVLEAANRGVAKALEEKRLKGRPYVTWDNGQIVWKQVDPLPNAASKIHPRNKSHAKKRAKTKC